MVTAALERNVALFLAEHGELEALRHLRATADLLIETRVAVAPDDHAP
jgi:hypothetical protein